MGCRGFGIGIEVLYWFVLGGIQLALHNCCAGDAEPDVYGGTRHRERSVLGAL